MAISLREMREKIADPSSLDECVDEVFRIMLGVDCLQSTVPESEGTPSEVESLTAVIGLGGALSGACVFRCSCATAITLAERMTGSRPEAVDDMVKDGVGELCNMLAGSWKGKIPELAAGCGLSVPAVITGRDYQIHVQAPRFRIHRSYSFRDAAFSVTIVCDGLE